MGKIVAWLAKGQPGRTHEGTVMGRGRHVAAMVAFWAALCSTGGAHACLLADTLPADWQNLSKEQLQKHLLRRDYNRAELAFEADIVSVTHYDNYLLASLRVRRFFKADGRSVELLWMPTGYQCVSNYSPVAGQRVILFGVRKGSPFARNYLAEKAPPPPETAVMHVATTSYVLETGPTGTYNREDLAIVTYLDGLRPVRVSLPKLDKQP